MGNVTITNLIIFLYSIYFNLRYIPFKQAIHIPILISPRVKIDQLRKGDIKLFCPPSFATVRLGLIASKGIATNRSYLSITKGGELIFRGKVKLCKGISIRIDNGSIDFGAKAFVNANCMIRCTNSISFGESLLVGWNVSVSTDDGHIIVEGNNVKQKEKPIHIGSHVWIASDVKIAKGVIVPDGCVVAQNSLVISEFHHKNTLIAGMPAKVIKHNIEWI